MKRLNFVTDDLQVEGKIIEYSSGNYRLRKYHGSTDCYYNYDYDYDATSEQELTENEKFDVMRQLSFAERVKRLHNYFRAADYISNSALYFLNFDNEDYEETLGNVITF